MLNSPNLSLSTAQIVATVCEAYHKQQGVFQNIVNAEETIPKNLSLQDQIQFMFWVSQMDYATNSVRLFEKASNYYAVNPHWIENQYLSSLNQAELLQLIKEQFKPRYANEIAKRFQDNSLKLAQEYQNQAINILNQATTATDLICRIRSFRGFGEKLANYFLRVIINLSGKEFADINDIMQPVDIHDVRLSYEWGLIDSKAMTRTNIANVQHIWSDACKEAGYSWLVFDKALWLIGSQGQRTGNIKVDFYNTLGISK